MRSPEYRDIPKTRKKKQELNDKKIRIKKIIYMFISIIITVFILSQVYFLVRYTMGYEVKSKQLVIYKWINKIEEPELKNDYTNTDK